MGSILFILMLGELHPQPLQPTFDLTTPWGLMTIMTPWEKTDAEQSNKSAANTQNPTLSAVAILPATDNTRDEQEELGLTKARDQTVIHKCFDAQRATYTNLPCDQQR